MPAEPPLVSCILPVKNGEAFLADAIESVLAQGHRPLELLVVDDGSKDATPAIAARFGTRIRYLHKVCGGPAAARNLGLGLARGELIVFQDADDLWPENRLSRQLARFTAEPALQVLVGRAQCVRDDDGVLRQVGPPALLFSVTSAMMRRSALARVGRFQEGLLSSDDVDWFLRARELGIQLELETAVNVLYRRHADNLTRDRPAALADFLRALKLSLDRRRRLGRPAADLPPMEGAR